jgi:serine/threonine-protein kinase
MRFCGADGSALQPERPTDPLIGRQLGAFRARRPLASGGMGRVYLAEEEGTGRPAALKVLDPEIARSEDALQRFHREALNHARLGRHPHVCALYDFGSTADGVVFIAMEYVEGEPLSALLRRTGSLPPLRVAEIVRQAADGLAAAHAHGLVHRDLKPENIMLGRAASGADHVTLIDFGIAKAMHDRRQRLTGTGISVGTPQFMSPEQLAADQVDARSDIYSLALLAFMMFTGTLPFPVGTPDAMMRRMLGQLRPLREARPEVRWPAPLQATLDRALAAAPEERHPAVDEFARELVQVVTPWNDGEMAAHIARHGVPLADGGVEIQSPPFGIPVVTGASPSQVPRVKLPPHEPPPAR